MSDFAPLRRIDGYLPLEDHGLVGDGVTAALVARDGSVPWLCLPRFDSPAVFCAILDTGRGGAFTVAPEGVQESRQTYEPGTGVLVTELRTAGGTATLTDALTLIDGADLRSQVRAGRGELLRRLAVTRGELPVSIVVAPRGGASAERLPGGCRVRCSTHPDMDLRLTASVPLDGLQTTITLRAGERVWASLSWRGDEAAVDGASAEDRLNATIRTWRAWSALVVYNGPQAALGLRSAITLKLLDHFENGAIMAAPTSSLPEAIGGPRNWDYRYSWVRDTAFSVYALNRIGLFSEAAAFVSWALDAFGRSGRPCVLYDIDGRLPAPERTDPDLEGYRRSPPVRWGNAAADQRQHDVFGEILDCAFQWARHHGRLDRSLWARLAGLVEAARHAWSEPDHGIWEVRTPGRVFTYSAALCQVALDRGARLAEAFGLGGDAAGWRADAERIREAILDRAWDPQRQSLTEHLGGGGLDAGLLALPLRRVIAADHPRMVATTEAIRRRLGAGEGLLYRYLPHESPDGLEGHEGAFLLCSFWLVDNLAAQGRLDEAFDLFESLCARANPLGLLPEQIDPSTGAFLGNYPQAFSHVGLISSGMNLARRSRAR